mmetsp:Transcript_1456/g.3938  ORF Transcript_1456/g.3938 Transcript_1456/m.3938 type:complete len:218 (+) Transcript_1456:1709-2362(+)
MCVVVRLILHREVRLVVPRGRLLRATFRAAGVSPRTGAVRRLHRGGGLARHRGGRGVGGRVFARGGAHRVAAFLATVAYHRPGGAAFGTGSVGRPIPPSHIGQIQAYRRGSADQRGAGAVRQVGQRLKAYARLPPRPGTVADQLALGRVLRLARDLQVVRRPRRLDGRHRVGRLLVGGCAAGGRCQGCRDQDVAGRVRRPGILELLRVSRRIAADGR